MSDQQVRDLGSPVKFFGPNGALVHDENVTDFRPVVEKVGTVNPDGSPAKSGADQRLNETPSVPTGMDASLTDDEPAQSTTAAQKAETMGSPAKD